MHFHCFGTSIVASQVALPELPIARFTHGPTLCTIAFAYDVPQRDFVATYTQQRRGEVLLRQQVSADGSLLQFDEDAIFAISPSADGVTCELAAGADERNVRHILIDHVLPRIAAARGSFVLHSSGVRVDDEVVLFLGDSGAGKSTIAAHFQRRNGLLLSDDCFLLAPNSASVTACPTYGSLRLLPASITAIYGPESSLLDTAPVAADNPKMRILSPAWEGEPTPLPVRHCFVLDMATDAGTSEDVSYEPLSNRDAVLALVRNSFRLDVTGKHALGDALHKASELAPHLIVGRLGYPRDLAAIPRLLDLVDSVTTR